jgi:lipoprotein-anchoring transpeptidase ErfK/SrfK
VEAEPRWGEGDLEALLERAGAAVANPPRDADIDISSGWVRIVPEKAGRTLDVEASRQALRTAVALRDETVRLETVAVPPEPEDEAAQRVILVRTGENRLYLYDQGRIVKSWGVATGLPGYPTPTGVFHVVRKLVNPTWVNPNSSWSKGLPARIGPGRSNPLGTHALQLDAPAILIHATSQARSIGYNESHGCIRMTEADERELFDLVGTGTRVAIVEAGPPVRRGATVLPPAATPEQTAAAVF